MCKLCEDIEREIEALKKSILWANSAGKREEYATQLAEARRERAQVRWFSHGVWKASGKRAVAGANDPRQKALPI